MSQKEYINDSVAAGVSGSLKHDDWKICPLVEFCVETASASNGATTPFIDLLTFFSELQNSSFDIALCIS